MVQAVKRYMLKTDVSREEDCKEPYWENCGEVRNHWLPYQQCRFVNEGQFPGCWPERPLNVLWMWISWGTVYCTKYALPYLISRKGSLVGVSSVAGFHGLPGRTGYSASKFAIHGFLETIRIENLKKGLHVMIIAPGFTTTEIRKRALMADGAEQGESPRDEHKLMPPAYVAKWVLKGIRKKKRNKLLTWDGRLTALFQRIVPDLVDWAITMNCRENQNLRFNNNFL